MGTAGRPWAASLLGELALGAVLLGGVGLTAIGVSGLLAEGMGALVGERFVSGDPPGVSYTPDRCADFFEYAPQARTCEEAATIHHFGEVVTYRVAAGIAPRCCPTAWFPGSGRPPSAPPPQPCCWRASACWPSGPAPAPAPAST
jgi:hypothetical protein